jgi:hypothetical protein
MYKILFFLHKTDDDNLISLFKDKIAGKLQEMSGKIVETAEVDNNFLLDQKYSLYCEIATHEREEMDKLMQTKAGKELNRALAELIDDITVIAVNYKK